jgi:zinc protease
VLMSWPLFVWKPEDLREQRSIELLAAIVRDQLIEIVRRELGETYSPEVKVDLPRGGDQGELEVEMTASPGRVDQVVAETRKIAADLASGGVTPDALERVRRPILDGGMARDYSAIWWVDMLDGSWAHPDQIAAAQNWQTDYEGISAEEVQAAAKRWLGPAPMVAIAVPKAYEQRSASR